MKLLRPQSGNYGRRVYTNFDDGAEETVNAGEVYYWPPGHTVRVDEDYEAIEFSPSGQMSELMNHLEAKLNGRRSASP